METRCEWWHINLIYSYDDVIAVGYLYLLLYIIPLLYKFIPSSIFGIVVIKIPSLLCYKNNIFFSNTCKYIKTVNEIFV